MSALARGVWARLGALVRGPARGVPAVDDGQARVGAARTPPPGRERALALGLRASEYEAIVARLEREPGEVELAMFSLLWSEHCAYKHSKLLLRTLPTAGPRLVFGPGENAGAVDVGGGLAVAFKVESHNHPTAVEPFQGAATGVGGILRDVFAVGARPVALLDSLRFGDPASERSRYLLDRAVAGIGHYGNSIGVPTVGGEVYFEAPYEQNCLVNAMCVGLAPVERLIRSAAAGPGNLLVLLGAATGRDGIGGASVLASAELGESDESKRPSVQIGDPFAQKKLMECSLELLERGLLVALQDLGAAGLTSAASEMAAKGRVGIEIDVARVPLREPGMEPFEIMVSESQERMLCVVEPAHLGDVLAVCGHWETDAATIGEVTAGDAVRVLDGGRLVGEIPVAALVDECPLYELAPRPPAAALYPTPRRVLASEDPGEALLTLLRSPNVADRRPLFEQYDAIVQARTVRRPGHADAAVLELPPRDGLTPGIALAIDCNGRRVAADPYRGTIETVLECAANLACVGAQPLGLTNCLNFGNPEKPQIAWQLSESVRGVAEVEAVGEAQRLRPDTGQVRRALEHGLDRSPIRVGGEPGLCRGATAGPHQLPQLRQPRAPTRSAARRSAASRGCRSSWVRPSGCAPTQARFAAHSSTVSIVPRYGSAANLACVGAQPLGLTNCLNFGNPEKPQIAWQLSESVRGLGDACRALGVPVVGGNVSLYNEGAAGPIYPTPVVGMVGELPDVTRAGRLGFRAEGDRIAIVGDFTPELRGSELARLGGAELPTALPDCDVARVRATQAAVCEAVREGLVASAHDIAEGGLATALAECCLACGLGAEVGLADTVKPLRSLFGEAPGGFIVSGAEADLRALGDRVMLRLVGGVGGSRLTIVAGEARVELPLEQLREAHGALAALFA